MSPEPPGANCAAGGTRVQSGVDADADGILDAGEVSATQFVCSGARGHDSLLALTPEPAGDNCPTGGQRVQSGLDDDDDGVLDADEVSATQYVCTGARGRASLVETLPVAAGASCAAGGLLVRSGFDANANGVLDAGEVVLSQYLCNGVSGASALIATTREDAGANCQYGGTRVDSGIDADADGTLDATETAATQYVCDGAPGTNGLNALIALTPEPAGTHCADGGTRIDTGIDLDRDGTLDAGEVSSTGYVCDGADGHTSLVVTTPEAAGANCEFAGLRIRSGLDTNGNLTLDEAEVGSTSYVCNGAPGANGQTSLVETSPEPAGANCTWGGIRVVSGLDADGNGLLDGADPVLMQYVCDGAPGLTSLVATSPEPAGTHCAWGGIRVDSGLDANRNGSLDAGELTSTYVCNGADGLTALVATATEPAGANCEFGGTRIDSGTDANRNGALDAGELSSAYVCDGAPAPEPLVATTAEPPGANCEFGGSKIDFATDANANGVVDPGEIAATSYACNGATGPTLDTVLAFTPEPPGANCPYGGTKVESGLDRNGNGILDAGEATSTGYVCNADTTHPFVLRASPAPGSPYILPDTRFCVTFSEPVVASYVDASTVFLNRSNGPTVAATVSYDPATSTACLQPAAPLDPFTLYTLYATSRIRDAAGNRLLPTLTASYWVQPPPPANLTVRIDSISAGGDGVDVAYTVSNSEPGSAPAFTLGFYVDRPYDPGPYVPPDVAVELAGLAGLSSTSGTLHLAVPASAFIVTYVDVWNTVAETSEDDNLGRLWPAITGPISASASTIEELATLTVTIPVNGSVRSADVSLGTDLYAGPSWWVGSSAVNPGDGLATISFQVPQGIAATGTVTIWCNVSDATWTSMQYAAVGGVSATNLAVSGPPTWAWADSGVPLTFVTVVPSTTPNLTVSVDGVADLGGGLLEASYTVRNSGAGEAAASTVGFFRDPVVMPGVGSPADATAEVPTIAAGSFFSGTVQLPGGPGAAIVAFADVDGAVDEQSETDNLFLPAPLLTGPVEVDRTTLERGSPVTFTVPVGPGVRHVNVSIGQDVYWGWNGYLGPISGNYGGEGFITGTFTVPTWWPDLAGASVWVDVSDAWRLATRRYAASSMISGTNLATMDYATWAWSDSGIPLTPVTVTASTRPNLTMILLSVTPSAGGIDVRFRASNAGAGDAGPFTVGIFVDPPAEPGVGADPQGELFVSGLVAGLSTTATVTVPGTATSRVLGYVDLNDEVAEAVETDNVGRLAGRMTASPVVTPSTVELTGGLTVTVPVNSSARSIQVELDSPGGPRPLGGAGGNYDGEGTITGTFSVPDDPMLLGTSTVVVTVWDDGHQAGRRYVLDPLRSTTHYTAYDPRTNAFTNVTAFPLVAVTVVPSTHPNLTVNLGLVREGLLPGTVDVPYTVMNASANGAAASTLGFFVNPRVDPTVGSTPLVSVEIDPLPAWASIEGTITLDAELTAHIVGYADVLGIVEETNEYDNKAFPQPSMIGPIVATPAVVDEGTLLTLTIPVTGGTFNADVYLGHDHGGAGANVYLGSISGNWDGEGFIQGSVTVPPGTAALGTVPVWVFLHNDGMNRTTAYVATPAISTTTYAMAVDPLYAWSDSQIPLTVVQVIPPTRPNLSVAIGAVTDMGDGSLNVDLTVRNTGAGTSASSVVGVFVDPPSIPDAGSTTSAAVTVPSLAVGASASATVNVPGSAASAIFAYADVGNAVDEQSETDNVAWVLSTPAMTASPIPSVSTVAVGGAVDVTVPVSASVRRVEIYIGTLTSAGSGSPDFLIGTATGNAAGEGEITVACSPPTGSDGDWYIWVATYDLYGLDWRGYLSYAPISSTHYTAYDPNLGGPPSVPTTMPLTALTVTP